MLLSNFLRFYFYINALKIDSDILCAASEGLSKTMYGVTNYSSLLDNLQKMSGDSPGNSDHQRFDDDVVVHRNEIEPALALQSLPPPPLLPPTVTFLSV